MHLFSTSINSSSDDHQAGASSSKTYHEPTAASSSSGWGHTGASSSSGPAGSSRFRLSLLIVCQHADMRTVST
jgi:hypothetical protein